MGHDKKMFRTTCHLTFIKKKIVRLSPFKIKITIIIIKEEENKKQHLIIKVL